MNLVPPQKNHLRPRTRGGQAAERHSPRLSDHDVIEAFDPQSRSRVISPVYPLAEMNADAPLF